MRTLQSSVQIARSKIVISCEPIALGPLKAQALRPAFALFEGTIGIVALVSHHFPCFVCDHTNRAEVIGVQEILLIFVPV